MSMDVAASEALWTDVLDELRGALGEDSYRRWFSQTVGVRREGDILEVGVPNPIHEFWIDSNFSGPLKGAIGRVFGEGLEVRYEVLEEPVAVPGGAGQDPVDGSAAASGSEGSGERGGEAGAAEASTGVPSSWKMLNPDFKMENFVVGPCCKFAQAAARAAVENPGQVFNPLLIHGGVGLGKTHLMQAIGHSFLEHDPGARVLYLTSEQFANEFIQGIQRGDTERLRRKFRKTDVLLIDDIQFFAGKDATQEEFFHTYNVLFDAKKQIVLTSDRPPGEIRELEHRLVSRFESGLTTELIPPDVETRIAILRSKMAKMPCKLDEGLLTSNTVRIAISPLPV